MGFAPAVSPLEKRGFMKPIPLLTRLIRFTSQCNTGLNESRFNFPEMDNSERATCQPASNRKWSLEMAERGRLMPGHGFAYALLNKRRLTVLLGGVALVTLTTAMAQA